MRNLWNRSIAFVLVLCMLLSVMPPLVLATETNTQPETVVYDFDLGHSALTCNNAVFGNQNLSRDTVYDDVSNYYDQNQLNWKYHSVEGATGGSNFMLFGGVKYNDNATEMKWNGICMYAKNSSNNYITEAKFALTLKSPGTGSYKMTFNYGAKHNGAASGSIYLLPGNTTDISAAITADNKLGTVNYSDSTANNNVQATEKSITFGKTLSMTADQTYILVFVAEAAGSKSDYINMYADSVELEKVADAPVAPSNQTVYDFDLGHSALTCNNAVFGNQNLSRDTVYDDVSNYYDQNQLNWKYHSVEGATGGSNFMLFGGVKYNDNATEMKWNGICMYAKNSSNNYITEAKFALTLKSPGTGSYKMTFNYGAKHNGAASGSIYLLPGNTTDISAAITADNKLGTVNYSDAAANNNVQATQKSITFDKTLSMAEGQTYILVFVAEAAGSRSDYINMYADSVVLEKVANAPVVPNNQAVYDFDLGHSDLTCEGGAFANRNLTHAAVANAVPADRNWGYHSVINVTGNNNLIIFGGEYVKNGAPAEHKWNGICMYSRDASNTDYLTGTKFALTLQSPGEGDYKLTLNYGAKHNGASAGSIYLLPGDTTDISAAITADNKLGTVNYSDPAANTNVQATEKSITFDKTLSMAEGQTYILVFVADTAGNNSNYVYMYADSVVMEKVEQSAPEETTPPEETTEPEETEPEITPPPAQRNEVKYNFDLGNSQLLLKGDTFANSRLTDAVVSGEISEYYKLYALDWKIHSTKANTRPVSHFGGKSATVDNQWNGIRIYAKTEDNTANVVSHYLAMTLRSPGTGTYYMTLDYQMHRYGAGKGSIYVLPGDTADVAAAIVAAAPVGSVSFDSKALKSTDPVEDNQVVFTTPIACEAGKEYIVVFVSEAAGKQGSSHMYLEQVKLTIDSKMVFPQPDPDTNLQQDQLIYDFDLQATDLLCQGKNFAARNLTHAAVEKAVSDYYAEGKLHWAYHSATAEISAFAAFGGVSETNSYNHTGLRFYAKDKETQKEIHNYYYAITLRSPGTGNYKLTVDFGVHRTGAKQGSIYILPGDTADVAAAIASGKAIGTVNYDNGASVSSTAPELGRSTYGNAIAMESGKEYILVFTADIVGRNSSRLYIDSVMLTKEGKETPADIIPYREPEPEPIPAGSTVYDIDLADSVNGIYSSKTLVLDVVDQLHNRYTSGTSNWDWEGDDCVNAGTMAFIGSGLAVYGSEYDWIAFRIKSPGEGLHTVGINHAENANGGIGAVYILPADTEDIGKALDSSNRVGKVHFENDNGDTAVVDGKRTMVGTWEFGADDEYIVVVEAYERSPYAETRAYMYISQIFMTPGDIMPETTQKRVIHPVVANPGPIRLLEATLYGTTAKVNGNDCLFMPTEGGRILVLDLDNEMLIDQFNTPFTVPRGMTTDENGIIWIVGDKTVIFRYDPVSRVGQEFKSYKDLIPDAQSSFDLYYGDGCLYFGTYPSGTVVEYEIATNTYTNYGKFFDDANYCCGVAYKDGYVYAAINGDQNNDGVETWMLAKIDTVKDELVTMTDFGDLMPETANMIRGANFAGDLLLLAGESDQQTLVAIDINTMELVDLGFKGGINYGITEEVDGKVYFVVNTRGLFCMDVNTREITAVPGLNELNIGARCDNTSIVEVDNPLYPGINIVTYSASTGIPRIYNVEKGIVKSYNEVFDADELGVPTDIRCFTSMGEGTNEFMIGAYNTEKCVIYNVETGEMREFETEGQTDALHMYKGIAYAGNYNDGRLVRLNLENPELNQVLMTLNDELYDQSRIHTITAGEDKIFVGSTPDLYGYGGVLAWIDLDKMERFVATDVVKEQTINCIVYHDGYIYGSTSIHGGTGSALRSDLSAKLFIYDVANKQKVGEYDLRDYMSGFTGNIDFIAGIAADPNVDENGRFWGVVGETLFSYTFDKTTGKINVKEELDFGKNTYNSGGGRNWFPRAFRFDNEGYMYVAFDANGGMRRINLENTADNERIMPETPKYYILGDDGNLYYNTSGSVMKMYPLNVTEENWAEAEKVDALILAIGDEITMGSEEKILAAREAYEALSMKNQALVQNLEVLQEAEVDLFELKIADLPETIELSHQTLIESLFAEYKAMTTRQQMYVKNYDLLAAANDALNVLLDKQVAAKVQEMIDSIKDLGQLTLDHKDRIAEIRAAYNALTSYQKLYVDATALLEAEAIIAQLRAAEIERLKELIASIGEVTLEDEAVIMEADGIFSWLTLEEREQVDGATLSSAKITLTKLQKAAAAEVDALIGKIGKVGLFSGISISKARKAYDALTEGSKAYVTLIDALTAAEKSYAPLRIVLISSIVIIVAAGGIVTTVVVSKRKAKKVKAEESVE